jgi:hypothetical protein
MRGLLACCVMLAAACTAPETPETKSTFDVAGLKPTSDGETATLIGWFKLDGRSFRLYPALTEPEASDACVSGVLLSLAGVPTEDESDRPMSITGFIYDTRDEAASGAANPCNSRVIIAAIEVMRPDA